MDEVTDKEIQKLSTLLPTDYYSALCVNLKMEYNEYDGIKKKHQQNISAAYEESLQRWKTGGGKRDELHKALDEAKVGGLVDKYRN